MSDFLELDSQHLAGKPHCWIQWKGTEVCMDVHCECGYIGHVDGGFVYGVECGHCHRRYAVGCNVVLHPYRPEYQIEDFKSTGTGDDQ